MGAAQTSKLTSRSQTTVPTGVRKALGLLPGDELIYEIRGREAIVRKREVEDVEADPVLGAFLEFLARDMTAHPARVKGMPRDFVARIRKLTSGVPIDHDAAVDGAIAL